MVLRSKDSVIVFKFTACSHQRLAVAILPLFPFIYRVIFPSKGEKNVNGTFSIGNGKVLYRGRTYLSLTTSERSCPVLRNQPLVCSCFQLVSYQKTHQKESIWPSWFGGISYPLGNWRKVQKFKNSGF